MNAQLQDIIPEFDWVNPDYATVWKERIARKARMRSDPRYMQALLMYYPTHLDDFVNDWGVTINPKNAGTHRPIVMPFVLFPKQREFIKFIIGQWRTPDNGILVKSRDCGASWLSMSTAIALGIFYNDVSIGFGSRKEDLVDDAGNPDSLFWKGRKFIENLPREFRGGWHYKDKKNNSHMFLGFPLTGATITGEAGDNIGRGGRKTIYFVDEFAFIERPKLVDAALSANTDCRIEMSSVNGLANTFAERARGGLIPRFDFSFYDDPRKVDQRTKKMLPKFAEFMAKLDPVVAEAEYKCNFLASIEGQVIEAVWVEASIGAAERLGIKITGGWSASLDVADLGKDKNAVSIRHGAELVYCDDWSGNNINPMITIRKAFEVCDTYGVEEMGYDASGMGGSWHEYFNIANEERIKLKLKPIVVFPFQGGGKVLDPELTAPGTSRTNEDYYENLKAQCWMALRMRFVETYKAVMGEVYDPENIISIDPKMTALIGVISELAQPTRKWSKNSKLMIDKTPDGVMSPNKADSIMQNFGYSRPTLDFSDDLLEQL